jgi:hypothetical protein
MEETGLCLFLPKRQFSSSVAPSFVEAVIGKSNVTPDPAQIALAEEMLVRLEIDGVVVRLNLLGLPGEQPDYVVASWVLPYVYALRGDRDWRRSPQLTGSRQVSQLAIQAYKLLETGDTTVSKLTQTLGREVTESAVLRAITELWQQLRIIPVVSAPRQAAQWELLRVRFQKAIAEGASTSQVTAISVLASIYLQAVIAASMEEVELFLAPLTARSKIREVLRGLLATRQVHTISLGHAPLFYVAGTLPEFPDPPTLYASSSVLASPYFMHSEDRDLDREEILPLPAVATPEISAVPVAPRKPAETHAPRPAAVRKPASGAKSTASRPHFSRPAAHSRDRKPAQSAASSHPARRPAADSRSPAARPSNGNHSSGNHSGASGRTAARPSSGASAPRSAKSSAPTWVKRNGHSNGAKPAAKSGAVSRTGSASRKTARPAPRPARPVGSHKPAVAASAKAGNSKRYGFTARPKQGTKKRG